ncbi:glycosyltransferase family 4 protein [Candidatus Azambacteria bacterium]|nr:glycosyltransferase family 4 protein [Candidatus Azambacteria bacterium]
MRLLIVTQKVDESDAILGFFHGWIAEFAKHCERVTVICLEEGAHHLSENVKVFSLGKEKKHSRLQYLAHFYRYIWQERNNYDVVFVHMNPEYIVLGGLLWKLLHKKITLWYTHKKIDVKLRIAVWLADVIFTASEKSFRLKSKKTKIMGHGIDTESFSPAIVPVGGDKIVLSVGRISPTKRQLDIVRAFESARKKVPAAVLYIVGIPVLKRNEEYLREIKEYLKTHRLEECVKFFGAIPNKKMPPMYQKAAVAVNMSETGSIDKDVLEALSCGIPALTTNNAFRGVIPDELIVNGDMMSGKIAGFLREEPHSEKRTEYRNIVVCHHSIGRLAGNLVFEMQNA